MTTTRSPFDVFAEYEIDEDVYDTGDPDEDNQPEEGDYIISSRNQGNARLLVSVYGENVYRVFFYEEDAHDWIDDRMQRENFYPNVWRDGGQELWPYYFGDFGMTRSDGLHSHHIR